MGKSYMEANMNSGKLFPIEKWQQNMYNRKLNYLRMNYMYLYIIHSPSMPEDSLSRWKHISYIDN